MKNLFLFGGAVVLLLTTGCFVSHSGGLGDYGYNYDDALPVVGGTQAQLTAALNASPSVYSEVGATTQSHGPASQSVVFYEGSQPSRGIAAGTMWTGPVAATPAPTYVPGTPVVNEPSGAAVGAVGGAPVAGEAPAPYYYGDGGSAFIGGTNGVTNGGGINISNSNIVGFPTNGSTNMSGTNRFTTNTTVVTNGNTIVSSNVVTSNLVGTTTPTNGAGTPFVPAGGATNNLNNLPRAAGATAGTPSGTQLINERPLGQPPTPVQSQALHAPTQPGPVTTEAAGAAAGNGTSTGAQSTPQNTTLGPQNVQTSVQAETTQRGAVNSGNGSTTTTGSTGGTTTTGANGANSTTAPRVLTSPRATQGARPAPAPAPAAPK